MIDCCPRCCLRVLFLQIQLAELAAGLLAAGVVNNEDRYVHACVRTTERTSG
jgi:hypothetical protein